MQNNRLTEIRAAPTRCSVCPIRQRALFRVVSDEYLAEAQSRRTAQYRLPARSHLYQEGAPAAMAYTLFDGWLLLYRNHSDGSRQGLRIALPGDFVGYVPLSGAYYTHGALAVTDVLVCGFRQVDLHEMIDHNLDLALQITNIQSRYLATCESNVLGLGRQSAEQRIAHAIADLYTRLRQPAADAGGALSMPFPLTQEMLGELAGLTPVHTNRVLRKLRADGVLACERQRVEIFDLPRLMEIGEFNPETAG